MNIAAWLLRWYTPTFVKKWALHDLIVATAAAFGCPAPAHKGLSYQECLRLYARFTQSRVEALLRDRSNLAAIEQRLYEHAYQLGKKYAHLLPIRSQTEMMVIGRLLYSILNIDFQSNAQGGVVIRRCYFSCFYTGPVCRVMSAMDRGLFAGLSAGGQLHFTTRITEGSPCCLACFTLPAQVATSELGDSVISTGSITESPKEGQNETGNCRRQWGRRRDSRQRTARPLCGDGAGSG